MVTINYNISHYSYKHNSEKLCSSIRINWKIGKHFTLYCRFFFYITFQLIKIDEKQFEFATFYRCLCFLYMQRNDTQEYSAETLAAADYTDNLLLLANMPAQDKSQLNSLGQLSGGIGLCMKSDKTVFLLF